MIFIFLFSSLTTDIVGMVLEMLLVVACIYDAYLISLLNFLLFDTLKLLDIRHSIWSLLGTGKLIDIRHSI